MEAFEAYNTLYEYKNKVKFSSVSEAALLGILHGFPLLLQVNDHCKNCVCVGLKMFKGSE